MASGGLLPDLGRPTGRALMTRDLANAVGGLVLVLIGAAFAWGGHVYGIGTVARMGAGFFPFATGMIVVGLGVLIAIGALIRREGTVDHPALRPLALVSASIGAFALLIPTLGFVPASLSASALAASAHPEARPIPVLLLSVAITAGTWLIFVRLLGLPIPLARMPF